MISFNEKVLKLFKGFCSIYDADIAGVSECYGMIYMNVNNVSYKWKNFYTGVNNDVNPCDFKPYRIPSTKPSPLSWVHAHTAKINEDMKNRLYFINNVMYYYDDNIQCNQVNVENLSTEDYFNLQFIMNDTQLISFQFGYLIHQKFNRNFFLTSESIEKCMKENLGGY